ncbi:septal ring lytic transglycosylase RlpA family protein [Flavobacterium chuncheonense]|uniref:Probable endolytic peptidoglycan transglycosylase RlpA n=1 Tax=Flavobacterium chuncheonense TaxID=2026653 RepID=A0ABW5YMC8_9FLAO
MKQLISIFNLSVLFCGISCFVVMSPRQNIYVKDAFFSSIQEAEWKTFKEDVHVSYYSDKLNGRKTASGEIFDNTLYTAAHKTLKFGTQLKVTNKSNGKSVIVVVNDRGPFVKGRELDLTKKAFLELTNSTSRGSLKVTIEIEQN